MSNVIGSAFLIVGLLFNLLGCVGLIRLPDLYNRLQAAAKCVTMGACSIFLGTMIMSGSTMIAMKCIICMGFILITSPTAADALAKGAYSFGLKLWDKSVVNKFEEDGCPVLKVRDEN